MQEFRIATNVQLPDDEFDRAAAVIECGKLKAAIIKLAAEYKLVAAVTHDTVTPRASTGKAIPAVPPSQNLSALNPEVGNAVGPLPNLNETEGKNRAPGLAPAEPIAGAAPRHPKAAA